MSVRGKIRDTVQQRVIDGIYPPGGQMPGVADVREEFDCSTATVVHAMRDLGVEGYVVSRRGVGYFATETLPVLTADDPTSRQEAQRDIVASLRSESRRLQEIADRLDRSIR